MSLFLLLFVMAVAEQEKPPEYHPTFVAMVTYANNLRAQHNLPPLTVDPGLMSWSASHTKWMVTNNSLVHSQGVAEIIASGHRGVPQVIRAWNASSGHRAVLLGKYRYVGAAGYKQGDRYYWCMQFSNQRYSLIKRLRQATDRWVRPSSGCISPGGT